MAVLAYLITLLRFSWYDGCVKSELSSYPGYFREPYWLSMGLLEISRVTLTGIWNDFIVKATTRQWVHACEKDVTRMLPNSLGPIDARWWQRTESTLAQVMACCLTAPSHYLNQCWLIISKFLWHPSEGITLRKSEETNEQNKIENYIFKIASRSPRGQWVNNGVHCTDSSTRRPDRLTSRKQWQISLSSSY